MIKLFNTFLNSLELLQYVKELNKEVSFIKEQAYNLSVIEEKAAEDKLNGFNHTASNHAIYCKHLADELREVFNTPHHCSIGLTNLTFFKFAMNPCKDAVENASNLLDELLMKTRKMEELAS
jgi:hypothetical protein